MLKKIISMGLLLCIGLTAVGCGQTTEKTTGNETDKKKIVLGTSPTTKPLGDSVIEAMKEKGYEVEVKTFDDFVLPNTATVEGSVDVTCFQHIPYLESWNEKNGQNLKPVFVLGSNLVGIFSNKYDSLEKLPQDAKVGIYQDASNQDRCLRTLEAKGVLKLEKPEGLASLLDIKENPKNIQFTPMDIANLVNGLEDLDATFTSELVLKQSNKEAKYELALESIDSMRPYAINLVVKEENVNAEWLKDLEATYKKESVHKKIEEDYDGLFILLTDENK